MKTRITVPAIMIAILMALIFKNCKTPQETRAEKNEVKTTIFGSLSVPKDRAHLAAGELQLSYARISSLKASGKPPIIFLQGGPGGGSLSMVPLFENSPLRTDHDIILFDARGTGQSGAYCKDLGRQFLKVLSQDLTAEQEINRIKILSRACKNTLDQQEVDNKIYTSMANAADIEALRKHLNIEKWILFGGSYGTRLGLTYMREYQAAEAAILVGLFPVENNLYESLIGGYDHALNRLFVSCKADPDCSSRYPELRTRFETSIRKLRAEPKAIEYQGEEFFINAQDALLLVHQMLYNKGTIQLLPRFIWSLSTENEAPTVAAINRFSRTLSLINIPTYWSVNAFEETPFNTTDAINKSLEVVPYLQPGPSFFIADQQVHKDWHMDRAKAKENEAVVTTAPVLIMNGMYDPITPITNAEGVMEYLPNATLVKFPNDGHSFFGPCMFNTMLEFISNDYTTAGSGCEDDGHLNWK